jgi:hypothetical protein
MPYTLMVAGDGGSLDLQVDDMGAPLEIQAQATSGEANSKTGAATIGGMVTCNQPADIFVSGELRQKLGRKTIITGAFGVSCHCDVQGAWTATVRSDRGAYGGGSAEVIGWASGCAAGCDEGSSPRSSA